jgi:hypothetical protein
VEVSCLFDCCVYGYIKTRYYEMLLHGASDLDGFFGKENEMSRACNMHGEEVECKGFLVGSQE